MKPNLRPLLYASLSIILLTLIVICIPPRPSDRSPLSKSIKQESAYEDDMRSAWRHEFLASRDPQLNLVPKERILVAKQEMDAMQFQSRPGTVNTLSWEERGPQNVGGRTRAFLVDAADATGNTVFAGGVGGGLWKTINFKSVTPTWTTINDFFSNMAITCIKQNPLNNQEMYFGTGEGYGNIDAIQGLGIWKSVNGGSSWTQLASTASLSYVNDLEFDNNGYIYATTRATVANLRGVLRSSDGGNNWTQVLIDPIPTATSRGSDLERAANGDMYATLGIFSTGHIFRSAANGVNTGIYGSWTDITPASVITNRDQRIEIAVCPSNSLRIYAVSQDSVTGGVRNLFRSDNSGSSWTTLTNASWCDQGASTNADFSRGQAWYDLIIGVDPSNANTAIVGGVVLVKTTNSGTSWSQASRWTSSATCTTAPVIHADIHEIRFLSSTELIVCTDGGIYYSTDGGASFTAKNTGYNVTQYYGMAVSATSGSNTMIAGSQDNGTHQFSSAGMNTVTSVTGGDGGFSFIDKTNAAVWMTSNPGGYWNIYRNSGSTYVGTAGAGSGRFISVADYADTINVLYAGDGEGLYRRVFNVESGTATTGTVNVSAEMGADRQVSCVKVDPSDETTIWLGCSVSETTINSATPILLKVIRANGSTSGPPSGRPSATAFAGPSLPADAYISNIDIEPGNSNHMLLTVSNYGVTSVWESTDGGTNWTSVEGNLPDMPIRWGLFIPAGYTTRPEAIGGVMLATELGVWTTASLNGSSTTWASNNAGLANVRTDQLVLRSSDKLVAAATHGRGIFTTNLQTPVLPVELVNFRGQLNNGHALLNWETASEFNSKYFELSRSYDGIRFQNIARITAAGNSNTMLHYSYPDPDPAVEFNYYRLKMVDIDGRAELSDVVLLKRIDLDQGITILNNPFRENISIRFLKIPKGKVIMQLRDMSGKLLSKEEVDQLAQPLIHFKPRNQLPAGIYNLEVYMEGKRFSAGLLKE